MFAILSETNFDSGMFSRELDVRFTSQRDAAAFMKELFKYEYPSTGKYIVDMAEEKIIIKYYENDERVIARYSVIEADDKPLPLGAFYETYWSAEPRLHTYGAKFASPHDGYLYLKSKVPSDARENFGLMSFTVYGDDRTDREMYFIEQITEDGKIKDSGADAP